MATQTFAALGVDAGFVKVLASKGITEPTPIQECCIPDALSGRDLCGRAQTGSGKTLAFGIPIVQRIEQARRRRPRALVLVPTRELARQIVSALMPLARAASLRVTAIYGGASMGAQVALVDA